MAFDRDKRDEMENRNYFARLRGVPAGFVSCSDCDGGGDGTRKCSRCSGSGQYEQECGECGSWVEKDCRVCDGSGFEYRDCPRCDGRGYVDARQQPRPTADGTLPLPFCSGLGGPKLVKGKRR